MCCILIHYYMVMSPVSTADRIKFMLGEEDDGPPPPQLFTELDELLSVDGQEMEWKETARLETLLFFSLFFFLTVLVKLSYIPFSVQPVQHNPLVNNHISV